MSDERNLDDEFMRSAKEAEQAERDRMANKGKGYTPKDYETIHWSGLVTGKPLIIRALGEKPDFHLVDGTKPGSPFDARVVNISKIINDKGKRIRVILPLRDMDENHIMWRLIDKVNEFEWVKEGDKNKRKFLHEGRDFFNIVNKNNLSEKSFGLESKGWKGSQFFVMNIIDRSLMDWHKENKHTRLLSKDVTHKVGKDGKERTYIVEGVPSYGFTNVLNTSILKFYGFWEKYDIGVERTGLTQPSFNIFNASKNPEKALDNSKFIVDGPLTEEEKSWTRYNLDKLFQVTSYTKLFNHLGKTIAMLDYELKTNFHDELKKLSEEEKARWAEEEKSTGVKTSEEPDHVEAEEEDETDVSAYTETSKATEPEEEVRQKKASVDDGVRDISGKVEMVLPPYWDKLSPVEQELIVGSLPPEEGSKAWRLTFKDNVGKTPKCPECSTKSPMSFKHCPGCGADF